MNDWAGSPHATAAKTASNKKNRDMEVMLRENSSWPTAAVLCSIRGVMADRSIDRRQAGLVFVAELLDHAHA